MRWGNPAHGADPASIEIDACHPKLRSSALLPRSLVRLSAALGGRQWFQPLPFPALLAKAFRGELVAQDSADEPAGVLLERVQAARGAMGESRARRRPGID